MRISDAMTGDVVRLAPDAACDVAARCMRDYDIGAIPIEEDDRLIGMITDRDIAVRIVAENKALETPVREAMTSTVLYCYHDQDVGDVARNMGDMQIRRMPVVDRDKRLVGIVSLGDIALRDNYHAGHALSDVCVNPGADA